jgi:hypothetical protein
MAVVFARHLDARFHRLGAGIGEKYAVGEGGIRQTLRQTFLPRNPIEIRGVPHLIYLVRQSGDQMRVRMSQPRYRYARAKVQPSLTALRKEVGSTADMMGLRTCLFSAVRQTPRTCLFRAIRQAPRASEIEKAAKSRGILKGDHSVIAAALSIGTKDTAREKTCS